tara:strand:- start:526 stop:954 length:429 start_codon:yes stop_codon:yes gene_type:complete
MVDFIIFIKLGESKMTVEVFNDVRKCDECESSFLLATESADYIEGKPNPEIHDETHEGLFCYKCISKLETIYNHFIYYVADDGKVDDKLTLTSDGFADLTDDIEDLIEKYTGELAFGKCSEIRNDMVDLIHQIMNGEEISDE